MSRRLSLVTVFHEFLFRIDLSRHGAMNLDFKGAKKGTKIQLAFSPDETFFFLVKMTDYLNSIRNNAFLTLIIYSLVKFIALKHLQEFSTYIVTLRNCPIYCAESLN